MSLINDALKKAQTLQPRAGGGGLKLATPEPAPAAPPPPPSSQTPALVSATRTPHRPGMVLALAGLMVFGLMAGLGLGAYLLFGPDEPSVALAPPKESPAPAPLVAAAASPAPLPARVEPTPAAESPSEPAPVEATSEPVEAVSLAGAPVVVEPIREPEPEPVRVNRPDPVIQVYIASLEVAGIRGGASPRVLMNSRVYAIGEIVGTEHPVRLTSIEARRLGFEDAEGNSYELRF